LSYLPGDENISIDSILSIDPLLTGMNEPNVSLFKETIYPNPASDKVTFSFVNSNYSDVVIRIYDLNGKLMELLNTGIATKGLHEFTWTVSSKYKSGMYVYEISNNATSSRGKLMISK
jgi:flagellar hook assembly protein FlgD